MSAGDITFFGDTWVDYDLGNLSSHTLKLGLIKGAADGGIDPTAATAAPHWGGTGTTNLASAQVSTSGSSYTGPVALSSVSWSSVSGVATLTAANVELALDASGPTNIRWGIIYDDSDANKRALFLVDFGAARNLTTAALTFDWEGSGGSRIFYL